MDYVMHLCECVCVALMIALLLIKTFTEFPALNLAEAVLIIHANK
jgi:hypothetical protein